MGQGLKLSFLHKGTADNRGALFLFLAAGPTSHTLDRPGKDTALQAQGVVLSPGSENGHGEVLRSIWLEHQIEVVRRSMPDPSDYLRVTVLPGGGVTPQAHANIAISFHRAAGRGYNTIARCEQLEDKLEVHMAAGFLRSRIDLPLPSEMTPSQSLKTAWILWIVLAAMPLPFFIAVLAQQLNSDGQAAANAVVYRWFIGTLIFIALAIPAGFFLQRRFFKDYWNRQPVAPFRYFLGMLSVWVSLNVCGLIALVGCLATRSLLPNLIPAILVFALFFVLWPNGHAMSRPLISEQDGADYEEPR
jgi:hypothetical protein